LASGAGLGEAIVHRLTAAGAAVVFTGRGADALHKVEEQLTAASATAVGIPADISRLADSQKVIDLAIERFGRVDVLVNNAALYTPSLALDTTEELFDNIVDADLKGAFFLAQYAAKAMITAGRGGRIINL
jgi:NAD(P)-dependent dehydrogenase (short-subunit alcohol dehydrogenase family)